MNPIIQQGMMPASEVMPAQELIEEYGLEGTDVILAADYMAVKGLPPTVAWAHGFLQGLRWAKERDGRL